MRVKPKSFTQGRLENDAFTLGRTLKFLKGGLNLSKGNQHPIAGAYSSCMQGMHCMPSHLTKKQNLIIIQKSTGKNLKLTQTKLPQLQVFILKSK